MDEPQAILQQVNSDTERLQALAELLDKISAIPLEERESARQWSKAQGVNAVIAVVVSGGRSNGGGHSCTINVPHVPGRGTLAAYYSTDVFLLAPGVLNPSTEHVYQQSTLDALRAALDNRIFRRDASSPRRTGAP